MKARFASSILVAALIAVGASGCAFITPQATTTIKEAADGVEGNVSPDIAMRNTTLISDDGKAASLIVTLVNVGESGNQVNIQYVNAAGTQVTENAFVNAHSTLTLGGLTDKKITFTGLDTKAGALFPVFFQYGTQTGTKLLVPVLTSDWPQFAGLAPKVTSGK
ncbi:hypothetical protein [Subtercola frigoramans]|uniref:hypothetical protein n=1 Tax=Subtercola frigoramans TaxID=120298 RepID=UPI0031CFC8E3